jgi:hypothetical protein
VELGKPGSSSYPEFASTGVGVEAFSITSGGRNEVEGRVVASRGGLHDENGTRFLISSESREVSEIG